MNDPDEAPWVRRALPKTVAQIGTPQAARILIRCLSDQGGNFERRKLVEALGVIRDLDGEVELDAEIIWPQIVEEAHRYLETIVTLKGIGSLGSARLEGAVLVWDSEHVPSLLDQLLEERLDDHLSNLFGLLALLYPAKDVAAAHQSLVSGYSSLRAHALEYLDNALEGEMRRTVFAVIDDSTLEEKLERCEKMFRLVPENLATTLRDILASHGDGREESASVVVAALYYIYTDRIPGLKDDIGALTKETDDPFVRETSQWVSHRLGI